MHILEELTVETHKIIVLKCGGSSIADLSTAFFDNIKVLMEEGWKPVIVHGGGPAIQGLLEKLAIPFEFVDGLRKTTDEMMDVVEMVLTGQINPALVRCLNENGVQAAGISGSDMQLLQARPLNKEKYGLVGEIAHVNTKLIYELLEKNIVPVISPVAIDEAARRYNVNADTAAGAVASALKAKQLTFVTDVPGILQNNTLLETVTNKEIESLITDGVIYGGMIPKVKAAMKGLQGNVNEVMIVNGKKSELTDDNTLKGTTITLEAGVTCS